MDALKSKWIWFIPTFVFIGTSLFFIYRGSPGQWHQKCGEFWKERRWNQIRALADNLILLNRPNAEVLYFAIFASQQVQDPEGQQRFVSHLQKLRPINWNWEMQLSSIQQSRSILQLVRSYRSRAAISLLVILVLLQGLFLWKKRPSLNWSAAIAIAGTILLFL